MYVCTDMPRALLTKTSLLTLAIRYTETFKHIYSCVHTVRITLTSNTHTHSYTLSVQFTSITLSLVTHILCLLFFTRTFCLLHIKVHTSGHSGLYKKKATDIHAATHASTQRCKHVDTHALQIWWNCCLGSICSLVLTYGWKMEVVSYVIYANHIYVLTKLRLLVFIFIFAPCIKTHAIYSRTPLTTSKFIQINYHLSLCHTPLWKITWLLS